MRYFCPNCKRPLTSPICVCGFSVEKPEIMPPASPSKHIDLSYESLKKFSSKRIRTLKYKLSKVRRQKRELWDITDRLYWENASLRNKLRKIEKNT